MVVRMPLYPGGAPTNARRVAKPAHIAKFSVALLTVVGLALGTFFAGSASAHSRLIDSSPEEGETLDSMPESIVLTYSEDIMELGASVVVADGEENLWTPPDVVVDGPNVTADLSEADLGGGSFQIRWRVVSADGHPISGTVDFSVSTDDTSGSPDTTATTEPTPGATDTPSSDETETPATAPADTADTDQTSGEASSNGWLIAAVGAIAIAIVLAAFILRGRNKTNPDEASNEGATAPDQPAPGAFENEPGIRADPGDSSPESGNR